MGLKIYNTPEYFLIILSLLVDALSGREIAEAGSKFEIVAAAYKPLKKAVCARATGGVYKAKKKDGSLIPIVSRGSVLTNFSESALISFVRSIADEPTKVSLDISVPMLVNEVATALTVIRGYLDLLQENPDGKPETSASYYDAIMLNLNRIEETILKFK